MTVPAIVAHDHGCKYARPEHGGHSDEARRLADTYNLHVIAGSTFGVIAVALADGRSDNVVYPDRAAAVAHQHHNEGWYCFIKIEALSMSVCEAESVMRFQRHANKIAKADRDHRQGGLSVIPRLALEDQERQIAAMAGRINLPIALGYNRE
jgi:hypothetical protein